MNKNEYIESVKKCLNNNSEVLLIVPPFSLLELPSIGVDILYNIANKNNIETNVFYANIAFAKFIGVKKYIYISKQLMSLYELIGERIFSKAAYPEKCLFGENFDIESSFSLNNLNDRFINKNDLLEIAEKAIEWTELISSIISKFNYKIVGITSGHQQTNSAIALINSIKNKSPSKIITIGGSACDGEMAEGILSLSKNIDYVFRGESELSWFSFLSKYKNNDLPTNKIIEPIKLENLDEIETSTYDYYFSQIQNADIKIENISILYEGSRGCWWGESNKCNFCGVNGWNKKYRCKSEEKIFTDISKIMDMHPDIEIQMVDTLMPRQYLHTLLPKLKDKFPKLKLFYEQRADISLNQVIYLKKYGINYTQVGIESLSSSLLTKINKGVDAKTNVNFLRFAKSTGCLIGWNFLYGIPNDTFDDWKGILELIPNIYHLNPPFQLRLLEIARFSPYFNNPSQFNISNLKPNKIYKEIYPESTNIERIAWLFDSEYSSYSKSDITFYNNLQTEVNKWMNKWNVKKDSIPELKITYNLDSYYIVDSRNNTKTEKISKEQAKILLYGFNTTTTPQDKNWAIQNKYVYFLENDYIPLATAHPKLFKELNNE